VLTVEALGIRGDGVAGGVFVPRSLPGEVVTGAVVDGRMPDPKVVTPSPDRVAAPCPHFRRCGGCALQHASDGFVSDWKAAVVRDALARAGVAAEIAAVETSPPASRRRAVLAGRRTKKGAVVGFHVRASDEVVAVPDCRVLRPDLMAALPALEEVTRLAAARGAEVSLHLTGTETGLDLSVAGAKPLDAGGLASLAGLGFARVTWNGEPGVQARTPRLAMGRAQIVPPPGAFLQATEHGEAALLAAVRAGVAEAARVVDLFAGLGTFALPLAETAKVDAVEGEADLVAALSAGGRAAPGLRPVRGVVRDLFRDPLTVDELAGYDAAVIDPPRAGARAQVSTLTRSRIGRIAFVSCNPATFARDAAALVAEGWRMGPVTVVDQFRWSAHVELVACFERG
jgi:23S rRNA (uracil1939-C5)-methyltransferase